MEWKPGLWGLIVTFIGLVLGMIIVEMRGSCTPHPLTGFFFAGFIVLFVADRVMYQWFKGIYAKLEWVTFTLAFLFLGIAIAMFVVSAVSFCSPMQDPVNLMAQGLNSIDNGTGRVSAGTAQFYDGDMVSIDVVLTKIGADLQVEFCCSGVNDPGDRCDKYMFDEQEAFECTPDSITATKTTTGKIMTYCPNTTASPCIIGFKKVS